MLEALSRAEVRGLTVSRVRGHGGETEQVENLRGTTVKMGLQEKMRLEIGGAGVAQGSGAVPRRADRPRLHLRAGGVTTVVTSTISTMVEKSA